MAGKKKDIAGDASKWEDVPEISKEEQPYPLPEGWKWVYLYSIATIKRGASPRPIKSFITFEFDGVNWIKIGDGQQGKFIESTKDKITQDGAKKSVFVDKGTLLLSNSMSFGQPYILNISGCIHDGWLAITPSSLLDKYFAYYAFLVSDWYFNKIAVGTTVRNLNSERVANLPVPFPPLEAQQRIVNRIESLFSKLDEAAAKVQTVIDGHEARKQAILHKAFSGELTKRWREENGVSLDSWEKGKLGDYVEVQYGYTEKSAIEKVGPKFLRITDIQNGLVDWNSVPYCKINEEDYLKYKLNVNDIVVARTGATTGKSYLICENINSIFASYLIRVKIKKIDDLNPLFLSLFFNTPIYWNQINDLSSGIAQPGVNGNKIKTLKLLIPTIEEQKEVNKHIKFIFHNLNNILEEAKHFLMLLEQIKKSILTKFFCGEIMR